MWCKIEHCVWKWLLFFTPYIIIGDSTLNLNWNWNCTESWRELGRRPADTLWFALGRSGGVTICPPILQVNSLISNPSSMAKPLTTKITWFRYVVHVLSNKSYHTLTYIKLQINYIKTGILTLKLEISNQSWKIWYQN